jgi:excisionase family DNA binding protein
MSEFLLTVRELARQARLNDWTVRRYIREEKLDAKLIGRQYVIRASEAQKLLGFWPERPEPRKVAS